MQQLAPIACNLSNTDFKGRALWLNELEEARADQPPDRGSAPIFPTNRKRRRTSRKMIRQEQECCAFLHFDLQHAATTLELTVTVTAPAAEAADARALFAHLLPD
ncbi:hypothetical protein LP420_38685 [Massilia sp. B-10]|nr:hypothetical protein LP420_38685 [Massilia sp. B-10]